MPEEKSAIERIIDAYFYLLKTRRYDMITVSSVIRKAGVNRSTFYRHFVDIYDLYDSVCDETAQEIVSAIHFENLDGFLNYEFETIGRQCVNTFDVYLKYKNKIDILSGKNGTLKIVKKFREKYAERFRKHIGSEAVGEKEEYLINLIPDCSMAIAYSVFSIKSGEPYSLRDFLPSVPFKKSFMSNILTVNDILSDEKSAIEYRLLMATYSTWKNKKIST